MRIAVVEDERPIREGLVHIYDKSVRNTRW